MLRTSRYFRNEGFAVLEAGDGQEGYDLAMAERPDLVILDIIMPKLDGWALLEKLRADSWGRTLPAIIYSNLSQNDSIISQARHKNVAAFLVKTDCSLKKLVTLTKSILNI